MKQKIDYCDLANFGERELELASNLLRSYTFAGQHRGGAQYNFRPESWDDSAVKIAFNPYSGMVFLTNEEYQVLVNTDDGVAMWYFTPYYGVEGTLEEIAEAFINDATNADGKPLPPDQWGNWETDDYCDARYLLDAIDNDASALINPDPVIERARQMLAALPEQD
jgi:hypothetical protein|nr:MAG TPA: hypothetical protein [Caudoviricetes sp.]